MDDPEFDLTLITYKEVTGGQSRTYGAHWLNAMLPENFILINKVDARRLRLKGGDRARIVGPTMHDDQGYLRQALRMGAAGYVLKKAVDVEFIRVPYDIERGTGD